VGLKLFVAVSEHGVMGASLLLTSGRFVAFGRWSGCWASKSEHWPEVWLPNFTSTVAASRQGQQQPLIRAKTEGEQGRNNRRERMAIQEVCQY